MESLQSCCNLPCSHAKVVHCNVQRIFIITVQSIVPRWRSRARMVVMQHARLGLSVYFDSCATSSWSSSHHSCACSSSLRLGTRKFHEQYVSCDIINAIAAKKKQTKQWMMFATYVSTPHCIVCCVQYTTDYVAPVGPCGAIACKATAHLAYCTQAIGPSYGDLTVAPPLLAPGGANSLIGGGGAERALGPLSESLLLSLEGWFRIAFAGTRLHRLHRLHHGCLEGNFDSTSESPRSLGVVRLPQTNAHIEH
jgi:hypothetical protein